MIKVHVDGILLILQTVTPYPKENDNKLWTMTLMANISQGIFKQF